MDPKTLKPILQPGVPLSGLSRLCPRPIEQTDVRKAGRASLLGGAPLGPFAMREQTEPKCKNDGYDLGVGRRRHMRYCDVRAGSRATTC